MAAIFNKKAPQIKPVATMPDEGDPSFIATGAQKAAEMKGSSGRMSTLLSDAQDGSGDNKRRQSYAAGKLGSS